LGRLGLVQLRLSAGNRKTTETGNLLYQIVSLKHYHPYSFRSPADIIGQLLAKIPKIRGESSEFPLPSWKIDRIGMNLLHRLIPDIVQPGDYFFIGLQDQNRPTPLDGSHGAG